MNMNAFEQVQEHAEEYITCWNEAKEANSAAKEIIAAVRDRIAAEKEQDRQRADELKARCADSTKSETVQRVARLELEKIRAKTYGITEDERKALAAEIERGKAAVSDGSHLMQTVRDAIWNASEELATAKQETYGDGKKDFTLAARWIEGTAAEAARL